MSEERRDQEEGHAINPTSSIENGNSLNEDAFRSLENRALEMMLKSFNMVELGSWAKDSSFFNDTNRSLEETDNFIRTNMLNDLAEKNGETNLNKEKQLDGGELQSDHANPTNCGKKDEILGLGGLQNLIEGTKRLRLSEMHDVDMTNEIEDVSTGKPSNKKKKLEEELGNENNGTNSGDKPFFPSLKTNVCGDVGPSLSQCPAQDKEHETSAAFYHQIGEKEGDKRDSFCGTCAISGDLVCCDGCPSGYHQRCLGIKTRPSGKWYCMYCRCKFCGLYGDKKEDNLQGSSKPMTCSVCDKKYHQSCLEASRDNIVHSENEPVCGKGCKLLYEGLKKLVGVKTEMEDGLSWSFICRNKIVDSNASQITPNMVDCNEKLADALFLLNKAFRRHFDTGIDMVHSIVFNCGSNFPRLDRRRFITVILEKNDKIASAATIRFHGNQLAEMPYAGTLASYRRQGMFKRLIKTIETALSFLKVELLVVPADPKLEHLWVDTLGFDRLDLRNKRMIKGMNLLTFSGTILFQKTIPKISVPERGDLFLTRGVSNLRR